MQKIEVLKSNGDVDEQNIARDDEVNPKLTPGNSKRISFPVDSILNAVIQDGDIMELLHILRYRSSEFDLNQRNHTGLTALHYAVLTNNLDSVKLLLNHGASVSCQDEYGFSPLHTAAALGFLQVTTMLIVYGADVFSLTYHSELPIDLAKDISVIRVLSNEMCVKLQSDQFYKSLISLCARKACSLICELVLYIIKGIIFTVAFITQKCFEVKATYSKDVKQTNITDIGCKHSDCCSKQQTFNKNSDKKTN